MKGRTMNNRKYWSAIGTMLVLLLVVGNTVVAKGPESVTISGPGLDQPIELNHTTDSELMTELMKQSKFWYGIGRPVPIDVSTSDLGQGFTVEWINMGPPDKTVEERTIRQVVYFETEYGAVVYTPEQESLSGWGYDPSGWYEASDELSGTFEALGIHIAESNTIWYLVRVHLLNTE